MSDIPLPPPFDWRLIIESAKLKIEDKDLINLLDAVITDDIKTIRSFAILLCNRYITSDE